MTEGIAKRDRSDEADDSLITQSLKSARVDVANVGTDKTPAATDHHRLIADAPAIDWEGDEDAQLATSTAMLQVGRAGGRSAAVRVFGTYPMKLIVAGQVARPASDCVWAYSVTYGGGLVSGDQAGVQVDVAPGCCCVLATQAATKVYKQRHGYGEAGGGVKGGSVLQALGSRVGRGAMLAVLPDPVICFRQAIFRQAQRFSLAEGGSLVAVDWLTPGRVGYGAGERWAFKEYFTRTTIAIAGREVIVDTVRLRDGPGVSMVQQMGSVHATGVVILLGPRAQETARHAQETVHRMVRHQMRRGGEAFSWARLPPAEKMHTGGRVLAAASPLAVRIPGKDKDEPEKGLLLRFAGESAGGVYAFLREILAPLDSELGAAPYAERGDA